MAHAAKKDKPAPLVPKLRFKEFEGDGEWKRNIFEALYIVQTTNSLSRENLNYQNGTVKNIHYGDIHTKFSALFDIKKEKVPYINDDVCLEKVKQSSYCAEGDLIFADASEDLKDIGKCIELVNINNENLLSGLHTLLARPNSNTFSIGFCGHLFQSAYIRLQVQNEAQGTKILGLSAGRLAKINVCYPMLKKEQLISEQQRIANCLTSLDEQITAQSQKLETLKAHKKGLMQKLFPAEGKSLPELRFKEFAGVGEWKMSFLEKCSNIVRGGSPRPINDFITSKSNGLNWLKIGDVDKNAKYITHTQERVRPEALSKSREINAGDLILSNSMSFGRPYISKIKACIHDGWIAITNISNNFTIDFVYYIILSPSSQKFFISYAAGSGVLNLNADIIKSLKILFPNKQEQQRIADCLTSIDDLITLHTRKIALLKEHKKGLMQQLFPCIKEQI